MKGKAQQQVRTSPGNMQICNFKLMILIIIIRLRASESGDHQAEIEAQEMKEDKAESNIKGLLHVQQAIQLGIKGVERERREADLKAFNLKRTLKKSAALLFAAKDELTNKNNELIR
jgi:hypothetical protein